MGRGYRCGGGEPLIQGMFEYCHSSENIKKFDLLKALSSISVTSGYVPSGQTGRGSGYFGYISATECNTTEWIDDSHFAHVFSTVNGSVYYLYISICEISNAGVTIKNTLQIYSGSSRPESVRISPSEEGFVLVSYCLLAPDTATTNSIYCKLYSVNNLNVTEVASKLVDSVSGIKADYPLLSSVLEWSTEVITLAYTLEATGGKGYYSTLNINYKNNTINTQVNRAEITDTTNLYICGWGVSPSDIPQIVLSPNHIMYVTPSRISTDYSNPIKLYTVKLNANGTITGTKTENILDTGYFYYRPTGGIFKIPKTKHTFVYVYSKSSLSAVVFTYDVDSGTFKKISMLSFQSFGYYGAGCFVRSLRKSENQLVCACGSFGNSYWKGIVQLDISTPDITSPFNVSLTEPVGNALAYSSKNLISVGGYLNSASYAYMYYDNSLVTNASGSKDPIVGFAIEKNKGLWSKTFKVKIKN